MTKPLADYESFLQAVEHYGFLTLSGSCCGLASLSALTTQEQWFTGLDTDPWQWRVRIVDERRAAYAKLLGGQPAFVSRQWYPLLLAARRGGDTFDDAWERGEMRQEARRIYDLFGERNVLATHEIKRLGGFGKGSAGRYESAMIALQARMYLTVSGMTRKTTLDGKPYSWPSTEYRTVETWAWPDALEDAAAADREAAANSIVAHIASIADNVNHRDLRKMING